jgi:hypothetical protein
MREDAFMTGVPPTVAIPEYPGPNFPVVFADAVMNVAHSPANVKFYLGRYDPDIRGSSESKLLPFMQVVMPIDGFAAAYAFFESRIKVFVASGLITQARVEELRKISGQV